MLTARDSTGDRVRGLDAGVEHRADQFERFWRAADARALLGSGTRAVMTLPVGPAARDR